MNQLKKYNHIISLGQNCEVAFQYTLSFGQIEAFPFNWAYVANVEKMLTALNKPELLFSGKIVYHSPSNMFFDEQSAVSFHGQRTPADLAKFSEQARAIEIEKEKEDTIGRVKHCFDKLFSVWASKESQLYIITFKEGSPVKINAYVQQLKHILASKTDNFTILVVLEQKHQGFPFTKESNIYYRFLKYYSPKDKVTTVELSDRSGWKKIFEEFQPQKILPKNKLYKFEKEQEPTIKILIGYHKPSVLFKSDILVPIHLGRALAMEKSKDGTMTREEYQWMLDNMIGDDTGDNISLKNRHYNEMTGIYWAWKNYERLGNPDYIGFMHYRRLFSFTDASFSTKDSITEILEKAQIFNNHLIKSLVSQYDLLTPPWRGPIPQGASLKKMFAVQPLKGLASILDKHSASKDKWNEFVENNQLCYSNMFIMRKELFFEYCEFIFSVLKERESQIDYSKDGERRIGFDSEFITDFFFYIKQEQYKSKELFKIYYGDSLLNYKYANVNDILCFDTSSDEKSLFPAFSTNNIPVVLACDNNYAPYGAITINSIIQNASKDKNYDIILLHTDISDENQEKIQMLANGRKNISIRIIDVTPQLENIKKNLFVHNFYSIATYFRILIPQLCQLYKKVLYLDTDVIACRDVALLYDTDITSYLLAATPDAAAICQANLGKKMPDRDQTYRDYFQNTLGVGDINKYFQAGVLVLNIKLLRENDIYSQFMNKLKELPNPFYVDQDILNSICYGKVKLLESSWNHVTHIKSCNYFKGYIPETLFQQFVKARQNPKIIHFTGPEKPWHNPKWILGEYFWKYAFNTPFTETLFFSITAGYVQKYMNLDNWTIDWDTVIYTHFYEQKKRKYKFLKFLNKFLFWNRKKRKELMQLMEKRLKKATFLLNKFSGFYKSIPNGITDIQAIESSKLFDKQYYSQKYGVPQEEAITHYCRKGWKKGYNPNPVFHTREYMKLNACRTNPLLDYIYNGKKLGHYVCRSTEDQTSPEDIRIYWNANAENRKSRVVYTCLTGNYDSLINHKFVHPGWRYVCFTDNASLLKQGKAGVWEMKELAVRTDNNILNNRYHKILPYDLFPAEVEESLYVDSNCNILTSYIFDTVENRKSSLLVPIHFSTTCLYQEMDWYTRHYPQQAENVARLRGKFLAEGFPGNYGMNENNIIYRRHTDVKVKEIMQLWWAMLKDFVPRDQLSFSYCLWKYGLSPEEIGISNARTDLKNFIFYPHQRGK